MIQIRQGVFETNSSSTHSICISREHVDADGCHVDFHFGEFGWENGDADVADYLYTAIYELDPNGDDGLLDKLKEILDSHGISYTFEKPKPVHYDYGGGDEWDELDVGYIDHAYDTYEFVHTVLDNDDMLIRYLFSDSHVYTGNDNYYEKNSKCYAAEETIWEDYQDENGEWHVRDLPNPNHDEEHYEYFFKGN